MYAAQRYECILAARTASKTGRAMTALRAFFYPIPLPLIVVVLFVSLLMGVVLCMPNQWADRFFRSTMRYFHKN